MYAQLLVFKTAPNKRAEAESMSDHSYAALKGVPGFKGVTYFGDPDSNEVLDAVMKEMMPKMQEATNALVIEPPLRHIFEVYQPK
jgi:hypothetical protein